MANFKRDGVELEIPNEAVSIVKSWLEKTDSELRTAKKNFEILQKETDVLKQENKDAIDARQKELQKKDEAIQAVIKELETIRKDSPERAKARRKLEREAAKILSAIDPAFSEDKFDGMSDREIQIATIAATIKDFDVSNRSDEAVSTAFDVVLVRSALSRSHPRESELAGVFRSGGVRRQDSANNLDAAYKDSRETTGSAWNWINQGGKK
jgi:hypothetical protein